MKRVICVFSLFILLLSFSACNIVFRLPEGFGGQKTDEDVAVDMPENSFIINDGDSPSDSVIHVITPEDEEEEALAEEEDEAPAENPVSGDLPQADLLVGEWVSASRSGDTITTDWYYFDADGTLSTSGGEYGHTSQYPDLFAGYEEGWQPMPMGAPLIFGTYELQGNIMILTYAGEEFCGDYDTPIVHKVEVLSLTADKMVIANIDDFGSSEPRIYIRNNYLPIEELCATIGVDTSID